MTLMEQIEKQLSLLPPDKQEQVLDFIAFLQQRARVSQPISRRPLKEHAAFGSWKHRKINALQYQHDLRAEWDSPDAIIWGTAKTHNAVLVTRNTKDFNPHWEGIRLPYAL